jgi:hypothetical protein
VVPSPIPTPLPLPTYPTISLAPVPTLQESLYTSYWHPSQPHTTRRPGSRTTTSTAAQTSDVDIPDPPDPPDEPDEPDKKGGGSSGGGEDVNIDIDFSDPPHLSGAEAKAVPTATKIGLGVAGAAAAGVVGGGVAWKKSRGSGSRG